MHDEENVEEWMGRLHIAAVECNYQEVDRQLKEQFIHSLNDKHMLGEIIKELMATKNDDHITSGGVLAWAKRVEAQRAQVVALNTPKESRQFDKVKIYKKTKDDITRTKPDHTVTAMQILWVNTPAKIVPSVWQDVCGDSKMGHFKEVCHSKRSRVINEMEQEMSQEYSKGEIETGQL